LIVEILKFIHPFVLNWQPRWHIEDALRKTVVWAKAWQRCEDIAQVMAAQVKAFLAI